MTSRTPQLQEPLHKDVLVGGHKYPGFRFLLIHQDTEGERDQWQSSTAAAAPKKTMVQIGDAVAIEGEGNEVWFAIVKDLYADEDGDATFTARWFYKSTEAGIMAAPGAQSTRAADVVYLSDGHDDANPAHTIICAVDMRYLPVGVALRNVVRAPMSTAPSLVASTGAVGCHCICAGHFDHLKLGTKKVRVEQFTDDWFAAASPGQLPRVRLRPPMVAGASGSGAAAAAGGASAAAATGGAGAASSPAHASVAAAAMQAPDVAGGAGASFAPPPSKRIKTEESDSATGARASSSGSESGVAGADAVVKAEVVASSSSGGKASVSGYKRSASDAGLPSVASAESSTSSASSSTSSSSSSGAAGGYAGMASVPIPEIRSKAAMYVHRLRTELAAFPAVATRVLDWLAAYHNGQATMVEAMDGVLEALVEGNASVQMIADFGLFPPEEHHDHFRAKAMETLDKRGCIFKSMAVGEELDKIWGLVPAANAAASAAPGAAVDAAAAPVAAASSSSSSSDASASALPEVLPAVVSSLPP